MSQSAVPKIQEQPFAIFHHAAKDAMVLSIKNEVAWQNVLGAPLTQMLRRRLAWYPWLVAELIVEGSLPISEIREIIRSPNVACSVLLNRYTDLAPVIEPMLHGHPASLRRILRDRRYNGRSPLKPVPEYLRLLESDPFRHYEALQDPNEQMRVVKSLRDRSELDPLGSASWTLIYIATHAITEVPAEFATSLARDEELLFRALHILRQHRNLPAEACSSLADAVKEPKWAFHVLSHKLQTAEQEDRLLGILHTSPPWLAEYWSAVKLPLDTLRESYMRAVDQCFRHECINELHRHYRWRVTQSQPASVLTAIAAAR